MKFSKLEPAARKQVADLHFDQQTLPNLCRALARRSNSEEEKATGPLAAALSGHHDIATCAVSVTVLKACVAVLKRPPATPRLWSQALKLRVGVPT